MKYLLLILLLVPGVALAGKCPAKCQHREHKEAPEPERSSWKSGFEIVAGFRWDREVDCPTPAYNSGTHQSDPGFLGLQQRLELNEYYFLQLRIDRDVVHEGEWVEAPHWNGAVSLHWAPWR